LEKSMIRSILKHKKMKRMRRTTKILMQSHH